jgi:hypothetical protein
MRLISKSGCQGRTAQIEQQPLLMTCAPWQKIKTDLKRCGASHHLSPGGPDGVKVALHLAIALGILLQADLVGRQPAIRPFSLACHSVRRSAAAHIVKQVGDMAHQRAYRTHGERAEFELSTWLKIQSPCRLRFFSGRQDTLKFIDSDWLDVFLQKADREELYLDPHVWRCGRGGGGEQPLNEPRELRISIVHSDLPLCDVRLCFVYARALGRLATDSYQRRK